MEGYSFAGWYLNQSLTTVFDFSMMPEYSFVLYAKWRMDYTIHFDSSGGSEVDDISLMAGASINPPNTPYKEGYIFRGWYTDETFVQEFYFNTMPNYSITLYAGWVKAYTIDFETNGGSAISTRNKYEGYSLGWFIRGLTPPTRAGYLFVDWYLDEGLTVLCEYDKMPAENLILYAKWIEAYTLSFESNGGSDVSDIYRLEGNSITSPRNPYRVGYKFDGWYSDQLLSTAFVFDTMPANDITLYAKWLKTYSISFETNGGTYILPIVDIPGTIIEPPNDPIKLGYVLEGWYLDEELTQVYYFSVMPSEDLTLYGLWVTKDYNVNYNVYNASVQSQINLGYSETILMVEVGYQHSGLLTSDGRVYMWGNN